MLALHRPIIVRRTISGASRCPGKIGRMRAEMDAQDEKLVQSLAKKPVK
jgi:hypothetical protein